MTNLTDDQLDRLAALKAKRIVAYRALGYARAIEAETLAVVERINAPFDWNYVVTDADKASERDAEAAGLLRRAAFDAISAIEDEMASIDRNVSLIPTADLDTLAGY